MSTQRKIFKVHFIIKCMFEWLFGNKKDIERVEEDTKRGFELVKKDVQSVTGWIKHLDSERQLQKNEFDLIKDDLSTVREEIEGLKNMVSMLGNLRPSGGFKTPRQVSNKQTAVQGVEIGVETAVQTPNLDQFSTTERALIWILLNTDMKLSYEDIGAMLGKEKSTVRSQINGIKQKSNILEELIEKNGKKRVYISDQIKEKLLKKSKVRVIGNRKKDKND